MSELSGIFYYDGDGHTYLLHGRETPEGGERANSVEVFKEYAALPAEKQPFPPKVVWDELGRFPPVLPEGTSRSIYYAVHMDAPS